MEHAAVAEAAVVPAPDALRLAVPKAYVVLAAGWEPTADTARAIFAHAREHLAPYQRIRRVEFVELPKTISGKIRRVELRARGRTTPRARRSSRVPLGGLLVTTRCRRTPRGRPTPRCSGRPSGPTSTARSRRFPDREALVDVPERAGAGRTPSSTPTSTSVARGLLASASTRATGSASGRRTAPSGCSSQYATAKIGAILVNINPAYRTHELATC